MKTSQFEIVILEQGWLGESETEYDLCSHGRIKLVIGGNDISTGNEKYGISESALALLRTLKSNHSTEYPVANRLIFHGCGTMLMMGCPIGINWDVTHTQDEVLLDHVIRYDTTNEEHGIKIDTQTHLAFAQYRQQVIAFALQAKELFEKSPRSFHFDNVSYVNRKLSQKVQRFLRYNLLKVGVPVQSLEDLTRQEVDKFDRQQFTAFWAEYNTLLNEY
jgi:hypothetical protein